LSPAVRVVGKGVIRVLQITEAAEAVIKQVRTENELPDTAALRITQVPVPEGVGIGFTFTHDPEEGDQTISRGADFTVYLSSELVEPLDKAVLEAAPPGEGVGLELRAQGQLHDHGHEGHEGHSHD
jgi:Fe-S cluster assembly iron-binding protein IscA